MNNRPIVEQFFGRMKKLFAVLRNTFRLDEEMFDLYFDICVCLTNIDVAYHPLTEEDGNNYLNYQNNVKREFTEKEIKRE